MKINKVYPSFYNGISEQIPELMTDTQCKDMANCIPDIVKGLSKRPPAKYMTHSSSLPTESKIIHTYDRGEDNEEYIFVATGDATTPLVVYDSNGNEKTLDFGDTPETVKEYLDATDITNLKALTVQDRTFIYNTEETVGISTYIPDGATTSYVADAYVNSLIIGVGSDYSYISFTVHFEYDGVEYTSLYTSSSWVSKGARDYTAVAQSVLTTLIQANLPSTVTYNGSRLISDTGIATFDVWITPGTNNYIYTNDVVVGDISLIDTSSSNTAFYWLKRSSGDVNNEFRYAVYLDGTLYQTTDDQSDIAVGELATLINASANFVAEYNGSTSSGGNILKIYRNDGADFTFEWWDSWGSQASFGWKGEVAKLSDLPPHLGFENQYVKITGNDDSNFTDYWVKSTDTTWIETKDPSDVRGALTNMPIAVDRLSDGTFLCSTLDWEAPSVGDENTNPNPSFVGYTINSMFFYKNRLGIASRDNIVLSETGGYYNFYIKTVLEVLDSDPIDVAIASTTATSIQHAIPFQGSLFIFTKEGQFEMISQGTTSPTTVSIEAVSSYPMAVEVEPKASGNSLFFISTTNNKQQLREYRKNNETLNVTGIDLNISTPDMIDDPIQNILINGVLGFVFVTTYTNEVYIYSYKDNSAERIQSAWSKWLFYEGETIEANSFEYQILNNYLLVCYKTTTDYIYNRVELTKAGETVFSDTSLSKDILDDCSATFTCDSIFCGVDVIPYTAYVELPDYYPHLGSNSLGTPKDKMLLKKVTIEGSGSFDATVYRPDYNTTYTKSHLNTDIQDLDFPINSRVGNCDIIVKDSTADDFTLTSFIVEGLYSPTNKQQN